MSGVYALWQIPPTGLWVIWVSPAVCASALLYPQVFKLEGICERDIGKLSARSKDLNKLHGRLAAAVLLDMCHDEDLHDVVAGWGEKERLLKNGEGGTPASRRLIQQLAVALVDQEQSPVRTRGQCCRLPLYPLLLSSPLPPPQASPLVSCRSCRRICVNGLAWPR